MKTKLVTTVVLAVGMLSQTVAAEVAPPRLLPNGPPGMVLVVGEKTSPAGPVEALVKAGSNKPALVVVELGEASSAVDEALQKGSVAAYSRYVISKPERLQPAIDAMREARCVWVTGELSADSTAFKSLASELQQARQRGAAIAVSGALAKSLGFELLPEVTLSDAPIESKVALAWRDDAVVLVRGRDFANFSNDPIEIKLAKSAAREEKTISLKNRNAVDLNELQRAAWGRTQAHYPPTEPGKPEVPKGSLVIIGGGGMPREIAERFVQLGGGEEGRFVVLPTAMPDPLPPGDQAGFLKRFGAKNVSVLTTRDQAELEKPETLKLFEEATAVWFGGGRQWRFVDAYEGTKVQAALHKVLERGGVIGGSSAGATIQGEYLVRGAPAGPHIMMCEGYERGFCFLPGVAIDQHFAQRKRFADMTALMKVYPQYLGIGLDEATAIVVQGHVAEVMGPGKLHIYDRRKAVEEGKPDYDDYSAGQKFDLVERKVVE